MKKLLALILALVMSLSLVACGGSNNNAAEPAADNNAADETETPAANDETEAPAANSDVKIGLICVEDENSGYDYAHIAGLTEACENLLNRLYEDGIVDASTDISVLKMMLKQDGLLDPDIPKDR